MEDIFFIHNKVMRQELRGTQSLQFRVALYKAHNLMNNDISKLHSQNYCIKVSTSRIY